jgi:hypothetical protein
MTLPATTYPSIRDDVLADAVLVHSAGHHVHVVSPLDAARRAREGRMPPPPAWMTRRIGG